MYPNPASFPYHVFDMDGTILDSFPAAADTFADVVAPHGVPADEARAAFYRNTHSRLADLMPQFFRERGTPLDAETVEKLHSDFEKRFELTDAEFYPGAIDALRKLRKKGKRLFLSSMSSDSLVERRMRHGKIEDDLFTLRFGRSKLLKGPLHIDAFATHLHLTMDAFTSATVMWGDTTFDMHLAVATGMFPIGIIGTLSAEELMDAGARVVLPAVTSLVIS